MNIRDFGVVIVTTILTGSGAALLFLVALGNVPIWFLIASFIMMVFGIANQNINIGGRHG